MKLEMKEVLSKLVAQMPTMMPRKLKKAAMRIEEMKIIGMEVYGRSTKIMAVR